jgi:hypothetical protein
MAQFTATLGCGLVFSATFAADVPPAEFRIVETHPTAVDDRREKLERFFNRYHCARPFPITEYLRAADGHGLDYRVLPAISIRETGCGKSAGPVNNWWGFHQESFSSLREGIEFLAQRLMEHPAYRRKALLDKLFTYNPRIAYPGEIMRIMQQIE